MDAVKDINLEIHDGEFFVLLGPSGCRKTTTLNLIAGLEAPTSGEIWFDEVLVAKDEQILLPPRERKIGMVFQSYALYPHLTVFENIAFPLRIEKAKGEEIDKAVRKISEMLKISHLLDAKPAEISGGERQRVAIGRALVKSPNLLLLDEPLSNLDAKLRVSTRIELKKIQEEIGITCIYVTHDQAEAMALGDRIAALRNGKIEQIGTPEDLYERPANTFVADFIGSMNLIELPLYVEGDLYFVKLGENKVFLPKEKIKEPLEKVILGIRPEHIFIENLADSIIGLVEAVENLGGKRQISVLVGDKRIQVLSEKR